MLRSSVGGDDLFEDRLLSRWEDTSMGFPASAGGNEVLGDCVKESQEFEVEETKKAQILLSLTAHHWNLRRMKKKYFMES